MEGRSSNPINEYLMQIAESLRTLMEEFPETLGGFYKFHEAAMKEGALSVKYKELIATGIAMLVCTGECAKFHAAQAVRHGATRAELLDTMSVAMLMGGGPGVVHAGEMLEALNELGIHDELEFTQ